MCMCPALHCICLRCARPTCCQVEAQRHAQTPAWHVYKQEKCAAAGGRYLHYPDKPAADQRLMSRGKACTSWIATHQTIAGQAVKHTHFSRRLVKLPTISATRAFMGATYTTLKSASRMLPSFRVCSPICAFNNVYCENARAERRAG